MLASLFITILSIENERNLCAVILRKWSLDNDPENVELKLKNMSLVYSQAEAYLLKHIT